MSARPQGWGEISLGEIASKIGSGATPRGGSKVYKSKGIPLIRSMNIHFDGFHDDGLVFLDDNQARELDNVIVQKGDVLLNITGASIGRVTIAPAYVAGARVNQHVSIIRLQDNIDPVFVQRFLASPKMQGFIQTENYGVTRQALTKLMIEQIKIPFPPSSEQRRIAAKLDSLCARSKAAYDELARIPLLIEHYKQAILEKAFSGELTADWRTQAGSVPVWNHVEAGELFKWGSGKFLPKKAQFNGDVPIYGGNGVTGMHNVGLVSKPTLVIGRVGAHCGNVHITKGLAWITDNAIYASDISSKVLLEYAFLIFSRSNLNANAGGSGQPFVNQTMLNEVEIPLPPLGEQREIVRRIDAAMDWLNVVACERDKAAHLLDHLDQGLLAKAFRGELVPQDPSDEPAEMLLERIRAARAAQPNPSRRGRRARTVEGANA